MTAQKIISKALTELSYFDNVGKPDITRYKQTAISALNAIYAEIFYMLGGTDFQSVTSLSDTVNLPERILYDCIHYGVAMKIASTEGDADMQRTLADIYNIKLGAANSFDTVRNVMPVVSSL